MIGYVVDVEFVWGFQARIAGLSKTSPSFYYPPPTTFLGALAEVIAKDCEVGESKGREIIPRLSENLLAIGWRPINCTPIKYSDINRIITIRKVGARDRESGKSIGILTPHPLYLDKSFDSPARGKTILSTLDGSAPKIRWFLVFKDDRLEFNGDEIGIDADLFWRIHRLGSKESRVSVIDVEKADIEVIKDRAITNYSFPIEDGISPAMIKRGEWESEVYINPFEIRAYSDKENPVINYMTGKKTLPFRIPILTTVLSQPEYVVEFNEGFAAYKFGKEEVVGRWSK